MGLLTMNCADCIIHCWKKKSEWLMKIFLDNLEKCIIIVIEVSAH